MRHEPNSDQKMAAVIGRREDSRRPRVRVAKILLCCALAAAMRRKGTSEILCGRRQSIQDSSNGMVQQYIKGTHDTHKLSCAHTKKRTAAA
jgi:hypothetical protein